jgi:small subunit ribosomal protein S6
MAQSKGRTQQYEGFFLVSQAAAQDLAACVDHITELVKRGHGDIIAFKKWDERRLAYEIQNHKRGVYFLVYFKADPAELADIERVANLSETVIRFMITRADHLTDDEMHAQDDMAKLSDEAKLRAADDTDDAKNANAAPTQPDDDDAQQPAPAGATTES